MGEGTGRSKVQICVSEVILIWPLQLKLLHLVGESGESAGEGGVFQGVEINYEVGEFAQVEVDIGILAGHVGVLDTRVQRIEGQDVAH